MTDEEHLGLIALIVARARGRGVVIGGTGSNDTRHAIHLTEKAVEAGVRRGAVRHARTTTSRTGAASSRTSARWPRPPRARRSCSTTSPAARRSTCRPTCWPSWPRSTASRPSSRPTRDELQLIDGLAVLAGNDDIYARCLDIGGAGGICVASHVVGTEMRRMYDEPDARAEIDASLQEVYEAMFITASPAPVKAALEMLGHDAGPSAPAAGRVRRDGAHRDRTTRSPATGCSRGVTAAVSGTAPRPPARRRRRDRQEHDRRRVRRPDRRRRLRAALPDGRDDGHRPRPARLHVPARARRRDRGDRDHARPRGPSRRAAVGDPRPRPGQDPRRLRRPADDRDGALEARRAQAARRPARGAADRRHRATAGPFEIERIHLTHSIPDSSGVALKTPLGTVLFTGDYKFDQTPVGGAPGGHGAPGRARPRGPAAAAAATPRTSTARASRERVDRRPAPGPRVRALRGPHRRHLLRLEHPPRPAGRARRREERPQGRARRPLDAQERQHRPQPRAHRHPGGDAGAAARDRPVGRREDRRHLDRAPRASRCRRCAGWPTATTRRSS